LPCSPPQPSTLFPYTTLFRSPTSFSGALERFPAIEHHSIRGSVGAKCAAGRARISGFVQRLGSAVRPKATGLFRSAPYPAPGARSEEHTSELQSRENLVCRLL